jgi:hypothetical protein
MEVAMSFKEKFLPFCFLPIFLIVMQNCFAWLSPTNSGNEFKTMASTTTSNVKPTPPTDLKAPTTISKPSDIVNPRYTGNFLLATMHVDGSKITALQDGTFRFTIVKSASDEVLMISGAKGVTTTLATTDYNAYFAAWNNDFKASGINMDVKPLTDNVNNPNFILWHKDGDSHQIKSVLADVQLESYDASSGTATLHFAPLSKTACVFLRTRSVIPVKPDQ